MRSKNIWSHLKHVILFAFLLLHSQFINAQETDILSFSVSNQVGETELDSENNTISIEVPFGTNVSNLTATFDLSDQATASVNEIEKVSGQTIDFTSPVNFVVTAGDEITTENWEVTVTVLPNTEKDIRFFYFNGVSEDVSIDETQHIIEVTFEYGTDLSDLKASFTLSDQATASIDEVVQENGLTTNDFTEPITYVITAGDGSTQDWIVTSEIGPNDDADILTYTFDQESEVVTRNQNAREIGIRIDFGIDITNLVASFSLSDQATVQVDGQIQTSGITTNDFSNPVTYTVTAGDGTIREWTVTVTEFVAQINLLAPAEGEIFSGQLIYRWTDNEYDPKTRRNILVVKTVLPGQTFEEAFEQNEIYYTYTTPYNNINERKGHLSRVGLQAQEHYVWKVYGQSEGEEINNESEIGYFRTNWIISRFYANTHTIWVDTLANKDLDNLTGEGRIRLTEDADLWSNFEFENIALTSNSGFYVLQSEIKIDTSDLQIEIVNESADSPIYMDVNQYIMNQDGLGVSGEIEFSNSYLGDLLIDVDAANYNSFKVSYAGGFNPIHIDFSDNFTLSLYEESSIVISENIYSFSISGLLSLPVNGELVLENIATNDLDYFNIESSGHGSIVIDEGINFHMSIDESSVDFSNEHSPNDLEPEWQGVIATSYTLSLNTDQNEHPFSEINMNPWSKSYTLDSSDPITFLSSGETEHTIKENLDKLEGTFYGYEAAYDSLVWTDQETLGYLKGSVQFDFISDEPFTFYHYFSDQQGQSTVIIENEEIEITLPYIRSVDRNSNQYFSLTWDSIEGEEFYEISISNDNFQTQLEGYDGIQVTDTTFTVDDLPNGNYQIRIGASGLLSLIAHFEIDIPLPEAPIEGQTQWSRANGLATLKWQDNSDNENGFIVEKMNLSSNEFEEIGRLPANTETFQDSATSEAELEYRIFAFNVGGNSEPLVLSSEDVLSSRQYAKEKILLYPNPFEDKLFIKLPRNVTPTKRITFALYNIAGSNIASGAMTVDRMMSLINNNLKSSQRGMYHLSIQIDDQKKQFKIIKNK